MKRTSDKKKTNWRDALSLKRLVKSFRHAFRGVAWLFLYEHNARIHLLFTILVIVGAIVLGVHKGEWIILLLCISSVLSLEAINSALERLSDKVSSEYSEHIREAKDLAAGAVLIASIVAAIVGILIFYRYILALFA